jgi:hypothetical protein
MYKPQLFLDIEKIVSQQSSIPVAPAALELKVGLKIRTLNKTLIPEFHFSSPEGGC